MESKKVYVHYEGKPEYTHVAKITWGLTAEQLALEFARVYNAKYGRMVSLDPEAIHLLNGRQRMSKSANLIRLLKDRSDIFVEYEVPSNALSDHRIEPRFYYMENDVVEQAVSLPETLVEAEPAHAAVRLHVSEQVTSAETTLEEELASEVKRILPPDQEADDPVACLQQVDVSLVPSYLAKALEYQQLRNYKCAGAIFLGVVKVLPKQKICLRGLASMALAVNKYEAALQWLELGVKEYPEDVLFHARLGDAYSGLNKYKEALSAYDMALDLYVLKSRQVFAKNVGQLESLDDTSAGDIQPVVTPDCLKVSSAAVLCKMGHGKRASAILRKILTQNAENLDALYQYGTLIFDRGLIKEALEIFLKLLISRPADESVRSSISKAIKQSQGMEMLRKDVAVEIGAAPALAFLASCVKDHGAIEEAVELYNLAIKLSPSSVGYFLNIIHLYEIMYEYLKALGFAVSLFQSLPSFSLYKLQFGDILPYFEGPNWSESPDNISQQCQYQGFKLEAQAEFLRWFDALPADKQEDTRGIITGTVEKPQETREDNFKCTYGDQHLDGLAILFTVTKILFFGGALGRAKQLARIIEPARAASSKHLHQTLIRNEAAYFGSVHQILEQYPVHLPLPRFKDQRPLYLAGDSHCMSAAWRTVQLRGQTRLLVPMLVTGLKVWHLRPESEFYPKYAFENAMESVADGAQLVMLYGEIDCRESILVSVEKGIYETLQKGVEVVVDVYLEVLQQLIFNRGFELFVHPVPPVLNKTRAVVHLFNKILKQRLKDIQQRSPAGKRLHWLDFVPDLLTSEGFLKEEFKLDGTHLSPTYRSLLQQELQKVN